MLDCAGLPFADSCVVLPHFWFCFLVLSLFLIPVRFLILLCSIALFLLCVPSCALLPVRLRHSMELFLDHHAVTDGAELNLAGEYLAAFGRDLLVLDALQRAFPCLV